jgi:formate dehydrogenase major subunit
MNAEGVAKLMGGKGLVEGPFPEHYEPKETPLTANILTNGAGPLSNPGVVNQYPGATYAAPGDPNYPIICTTYRLTEHWHGGGCTRNTPTQCQLMPEPFIEMSEELAAIKGISNGDSVEVYLHESCHPVILKACDKV